MYRLIDENKETIAGNYFRATILDEDSGETYLYQILVGSSGGMGWVVDSFGNDTPKMWEIINWLYRVDTHRTVYKEEEIL